MSSGKTDRWMWSPTWARHVRSGLVRFTRFVAGTSGDIQSNDGASSQASDLETRTETHPPRTVAESAIVTDEERARRFLRSRGGRMKQSALVECTGWSKSKVSRLLSQMEADGRVERIPIGREKFVSLPGHMPEAAKSKFDGEDVRAKRVSSE